MREFKVTKKSQYDALKEFISATVFYSLFIIFLLIALLLYSEFKIKEMTIILLCVLIPYVFYYLYPVVTIHLNYLKNAVYQVVVLSQNQIKLDNTNYISDNIKKIDIYASYIYFAGGNGTYYTAHEGTYYRVDFFLVSGERIHLSSLYGQDLYTYIKECFVNTPIIEHKLLFVPKYLIN